MWDRLVALFIAQPRYAPLSPDLTQALAEIPFVRRLSGRQRKRFVKLVHDFLEVVAFDCPPGAPATDAERAWVAASCALLFVGRPEWSFPPVRRVRLSLEAFCEKTYRPRAGGAYHGLYNGGPLKRRLVSFTRGTLASSFDKARDGYHLGVHEFAHALDDADLVPELDGVPTHLPAELLEPWLRALKRALESAKTGQSVLRAYGGTHPRETFAVAVETFYEQPIRLRAQEPDLYGMLSGLLKQDPAAYDEQQLRLQVRARAVRLVEELVVKTPAQPKRTGRLTWESTPQGLMPSLTYITKAGDWSRSVRPSREQLDVRLLRATGGASDVDLELDAGLTRRVRPAGAPVAVTRKLFARLAARLKEAYPETPESQREDALWHALERAAGAEARA